VPPDVFRDSRQCISRGMPYGRMFGGLNGCPFQQDGMVNGCGEAMGQPMKPVGKPTAFTSDTVSAIAVAETSPDLCPYGPIAVAFSLRTTALPAIMRIPEETPGYRCHTCWHQYHICLTSIC